MKEWFEGKSVALIGNAESLFHKEYGNEIESHDVVVRLNKAAMLYTRFDCEISHGKRTDVWMFWNIMEYKHFSEKTSAKIMHMGHQGRNSTHIKKVDFIYPDVLYSELKKHAGTHNNPTTGLMSLDYISNCNPYSITVYGYDWKETPTFTDPTRVKDKRCPHDYETEKAYCTDVFFSKSNIELRQ